jgi:DNA-binding response OmpR family regulator
MSILVVDDDLSIKELLTRFLKEQGLDVISSGLTKEAREILEKHTIDVMIVDVMMPGESGFDFVKSLTNKPPVLFLTACDSLDDKIKGFLSGGDDYLTKPFEPLELIYRLRALMKRHPPAHGQIGDYTYHQKELCHKATQKRISLSALEINILETLMSNSPHSVSRETLSTLNRVDMRTIDTQINRLRKKIGDKDRTLIKTVRHIGYSLIMG